MAVAFIIFCSVLLSLLILLSRTEFKGILLFALFLRLFLMTADLNHWFPILHSGADSERFDRTALWNQNKPPEAWDSVTNYTNFLTIVYSTTDNSRPIAQFINVLLGMGLLLLIEQCLQLMQVPYKRQKTVMWIAALIPHLVIFSGILLREAWCEFFVALSLLCFLKWFYRGGISNILGSLLCVLCACYMHSGCMAIAVGYFLAFITYSPSSRKVSMSFTSILACVLVVLFVSVISANMDMFGDKFAKVDMEEADEVLMESYAYNGGGSDYMTWAPTNNFAVSLLLSPVKMVYFLFSPIPFDWRGINDIFAFLIDSMVYLYLLYRIYRSRERHRMSALLKRYLLAAFLATSFVFALGCTNAGTAMRHRAKFVSIAMVAYGATESMRSGAGFSRRINLRRT